MSRSGWSKRLRTGAFPALCEVPQGPGIHVYLFWSKDGERYLSHTGGGVTAEELCISAAEAVGITPLCHVLFALYNPQSHCWYSPNHTFTPDDSVLILHYCLRFYFRNWHGLNEKEPTVSRYALRSGTSQGVSPLFEIKSLEYLFFQVGAKYEFVNEVVQMEEVQSKEEQSRFKNESLGMAVLQLLHQSMQTGCTLQDVAEQVSYLHCIPRSFAKHMSKDNFLTKIRIRRVFAAFVRTFQQHTVAKGRLGTQEIMCKYISTLEHMVPRFGTETFTVSHLELRDEGNGSSSHSNATHCQCASKDELISPATREILVSGTEGIQWRLVSEQKVCQNLIRSFRRSNSVPSLGFVRLRAFFSCFDLYASVGGSSDCKLVVFLCVQEARSFISLLDGYNRLTAFAHHYLCHEVAPPRVVMSVANGLHGPMHDDFVLLKLKKEAAEEGAFLVRWSGLHYRCIILAVLNKNEVSQHPRFLSGNYCSFRIQLKDSMFCLEGWDREFSSLCLLGLFYSRHLLTQLSFHQIKDKDIVQEQHLGRGTRTNIFSGRLLVRGGGENDEDDEFNNNSADHKGIQVVLKILEQSDKDIDIGFLETASLMNQVSHSHLVFVHGVSVKGSENIMVEEFVEFGPLDVFLRKEKASVTPQWKFIVAKQLASALNYLETKQLVHGNVCAKNILVARHGLKHGTTPFVKLSDPGISLSVLSREERLERIPWIAPECIDSGSPIVIAADQWSFGVTLLEICNNGDLPMSGCTLSEKERFYQQKGRLAEPSSQELASFISMCLTYEPLERPSFRTVLRELTEIMIKNPDISPSEALPHTDPSVFHKRYLKKMRDLGEGHFGMVTLYLYDPANDGTGEHVAVKALKQENGHVPEGWMKEIEILKSLYHSNIVKYKGCCTELGGHVVQLIMEYLPLGSLREYLSKRKLGVPQCLMFAQQICQGMEYLHTKRYIHRDLAARNVLVENDSLVKIGDFGLTKYIPEGDIYYRVREDGDSPVFWYAIECLKESKFSFSSDIWSFGVTLYEILTRCDPRQSPPTKFTAMMQKDTQSQMTVIELIKLLDKQLRLPRPKDCPHEVRMLMEQCWAAEPIQRPSFGSLIEKFEAVRQTYNWQSNISFSLAQI
uniref:Tyrosine-protein kinase n=1 Tax=Cyclopterus lumpus TaxID=8103 RepID=A0A8C3AF84_CYCLU